MKRKLIKIALFVTFPALICISVILKGKQFLLIAFSGVIFALLMFFSGIERKNLTSRKLVILSIMTALCLMGRIFPVLKPVTAIIILTGMHLNAESGFFTGAMAAFLSNFYFGQGPWTIFQMFTWGMIGFFAGIFSTALKKNQIFLLSYGVISGIVYSFSMDVWTVLWYSGEFNGKLYLSAIFTALPFTMLYCIGNVIFLVVLAEPIGKKLFRLHTRYGI